MKHILQFTMFHIISLQTAHNIMEIRNTSRSTTKEKVLVLQCFRGRKYKFFLSSYQFSFLFLLRLQIKNVFLAITFITFLV